MVGFLWERLSAPTLRAFNLAIQVRFRPPTLVVQFEPDDSGDSATEDTVIEVSDVEGLMGFRPRR